MLRFFFAWCLPILLLLLVDPRVATADEVHVCVRPPGVPANLERWVFAPGGNKVWLDKRFRFEAKAQGRRVFVFNPWAPPGSVARLPIPHNKLQCPRPPPRPKASPPKNEPKPPAEESKPAAPAKPPPKPVKDEPGEVVPPGVKKMPEPPPGKPRPSPPPPNGVLSNAPLLPPEGVLAQESVLPRREEVSPPKYVDEEQTLVDRGGTLPELQHRPGRPLVSAVPCKEIKGGCKGEGEKEEETGFDGLAKQLALAAGLATLQPEHDLERKDGKKYGIVGGENADGINHPAVQAVVSFLQLSAVGRAQVKAFEKKLREVVKKKAPAVIHSAKELSDDAIAYLRKKYGKEKLAASLAQDQAIGPYEVMSKFTDGLKGEYQAHHILEVNQAITHRITKELDKIPSVVLTRAEHVRFNNLFSEARSTIKNRADLWKLYEDAYVDHPHWLDAISATRQGWSERNEKCDDLMKFGLSSSGWETRPEKGEARPAGSEPCDGRGDAVGEA